MVLFYASLIKHKVKYNPLIEVISLIALNINFKKHVENVSSFVMPAVFCFLKIKRWKRKRKVDFGLKV